MRYLVIIFSLVAGLSLALGHGTAHAAKSQPVVIPPTQITYTRAQTLPYEFEPLDINNPDVTPLPEIDLVSVSFINTLGSVALTLFAIFDQFSILPIFLVLMLAVTILFFLWRYVTNRPSTVELRVSEASHAVTGFLYDQVNVAPQVFNLAIRERENYIAQQQLLEQGFAARFEDKLYSDPENFVDNLEVLGTGRQIIREDIDIARGRISRLRNQQAGFRKGLSLFRRAKRSFGGNPFR